MRVQSLTMNRAGQIIWHVRRGFHCGPADQVRWTDDVGQLPVNYTIELVCQPKLDKRGFLVDQVNVHKFIERYASQPTPLSCEQGCIGLAEAIAAKMSKDAPHCVVTRLRLSLSPAPFAASMTVELSGR